MNENREQDGRTALSRRGLLLGCAAAALAIEGALTRPAQATSAPSFTLASGNYRVKVCPITGGSRLECIVEELTKNGWKPVPDTEVLVRPVSEKGAFDAETTDDKGKTKHSKYKYPVGTQVNVSVPGLIPAGKGKV